MLGTVVADPDGTEGPPGEAPGLGLLRVTTVLESPKTVRSVVAQETATGLEVPGYEIHCGRTDGGDAVEPFLSVEDEVVGVRSNDGLVPTAPMSMACSSTIASEKACWPGSGCQ